MSEHKRRSNLARSVCEPHGVSPDHVKPEPRAEQRQSRMGLLTLCSPSTLNANLSASGGSLVSSPAFCSNTVSGDVNISNYFVAVKQGNVPVMNEHKALAQETDSDALSKTVLRSPKRVKRKPQISFHQSRGKKLHSASRSSLDDVNHQLDLLVLAEGNMMSRESLCPPEEHFLTSLTGEITGTRVTADYHCHECGSAISSFKANAFRVKCSQCKLSWKCSKLQCTCTAEITIELSDRTKWTVVLSDPLLRSIVRFKTEGYCNTDTVEEKVLKVGRIRVDYMDRIPKRVQRIAAGYVST